MTRRQLEHIIRASSTIADDPDIVVLGSQAILGAIPNAPPELLISKEADVFPRNFPHRSDIIDGAIGEGSPFEKSFGYYAHGIEEKTAVLALGWKDRLVLVSGKNTEPGRGWCLEPHDLALAKYVAGREKDMDFNGALAKHKLVDREVLWARFETLDISSELRLIVAARIRSQFGPRSGPA